MVEHNRSFKNEDGTEVVISMKTDCHTEDEMHKAVSFMAQSSRKFYLKMAEKINNKL